MSRFENPESILLRKGSPEELNEKEEALYKLLVPENRHRAISIEKFSDLYAPEVIATDQAFVRTMNERFERNDDASAKKGKLRSELFEAIVNTQIAESDWMGPDADIIVPSRYDDIKNGVDSIVEFTREEGGDAHLALAMDVTESIQNMEEKFNTIKASIRTKSLSRVKYFRSKNLRAELTGVPRVVIGASRETVASITELLLRFKRLQKTVAESRTRPDQTESSKKAVSDIAAVRDAIAMHPMQSVIISEIRAQLEAFRNYAHKMGEDETAELYSPVLAIIEGIAEEKGELAKVTEESAKDPIYRMIMDKAEQFGE